MTYYFKCLESKAADLNVEVEDTQADCTVISPNRNIFFTRNKIGL